jgi:hypothetical protein
MSVADEAIEAGRIKLAANTMTDNRGNDLRFIYVLRAHGIAQRINRRSAPIA